MKKQLAVILLVLSLLMSTSICLPAACAADGIVNAIKPVSGEAVGNGVREVAITAENWVDYFSVEQFNNLTDELRGTVHLRSLQLDYRLVLREQYRDRLVRGEDSLLNLTFRYQECTGSLLIDFSNGTVTDNGDYAAVKHSSAEAAVRISAPYDLLGDNLLASKLVLCMSEDGKEFGTIFKNFEMTSVSGVLRLYTEDSTVGESDRPSDLIAKGITGNVQWKLNSGGTFTVYGEGDMGSGVGTSPWEQYKDKILRVVVEDGVCSVGSNAFSGCQNLRSVELPNSVKRIETYAFSGCKALTVIRIPAAVSLIETGAFFRCPALKLFDVAPENGSFTADGFALYNRDKTRLISCTAAVNGSFVVPETVREIARGAFREDTNLHTVTLPGTLELVETEGFFDCDGLETVIWNGTLQQWEELTIKADNEALTSAELVFTKIGNRPSLGVMETLVDDGRLQVLCRDNFMEIELSGLDLSKDLILDRSGSPKNIMEYSWKVSFSDGNETYTVGSYYLAQNPGLDRVGSFDETTSGLMLETGTGAWRSIGEIPTVSHTDSSIHWSFEIPADYSFDSAAIRSFHVEITEFATLTYEKETHYVPVAPGSVGEQSIGRVITLGSFEQDNLASDGAEPLNWIILDVEKDRALVLCTKGIDSRPWHAKYETVSWKGCDLRAWLNGEFLETAFSPDEREQILSTSWSNTADPLDTADTTEKISLLSLSEVRRYLVTEEQLLCEPTAYALGRGAEEIHGGVSWWLRTSGARYQSAAVINWFADEDAAGHMAVSEDECVRPCFWLRLGE